MNNSGEGVTMRNYIKYIFFLLFFTIWVSFSFAQFIYFPYYGKNKVLYDKFDWKHYKTDHFDVYYYKEDIQVLKKIAELAESAYQRISQDIKHSLSALVPLLFFETFTDLEQTNLLQVPEGLMGVAEPLLYRIAIQGDMAIDEIQDLIAHELTHIFEFDLLWGSPGGVLYHLSQPPGWVMEGFSEYNTHNWSPWSALIVRDAVLNDRIPELNKRGQLFSRYPLPRNPNYEFGHAIFEFIEHKYGKTGIRDFWHSMKNSPLIGRQDPIKKIFKLTPKEFTYEYKKYLRAKNKKFLLREAPEDYSVPIGPEFPLNPYYFSFSHALSPSGDIVAALLANYKELDYDIILFSTKDGKVIKNITKGYTLKYEHIKFELDPTKGKDLAWSSDGDKIAFFGRAGQKHSLFIINALSGKIENNIKIPLDQPGAPHFYPEREELIFTAFQDGSHDIFKINLWTEKILNLTEDDLFEKAPAISPDGKYVAYTIRIDTYDKLFLSPINNLNKKTQLTFGRGNTITPEFSSDSKEIFFSGDMREAFNIYSLNLETNELKRYTDVRTGNFFPIPLPKDPKKIIFSSFNKGAFQIFKSEFEGEVEKTITFAEIKAEEEFQRFEPIITIEINKDKIKTYKGLGKLYLTSRPPIDTIISTDGSIYGGSAISFTDLMGDHNFSFSAYQVRSFRSYSLTYMNLKRRLHYMASAFQYTMFYYTPYAYYDPTYYNYLSYRDAMATRKMTGLNIGIYYPLSKYYRTEARLGFSHYEEEFYNQGMTGYGSFWNGNWLSASISITGETTRFNYYGPKTGNTFRFSITQGIPISGFLQNTTLQADFRQYLYIGADSLFAFRFNGFASRGKNPYVSYFGGNNQVRSANYYSIIATEGWYANLEFRFPLVNAATTLIGQLGPIRGVLFLDVSRSKLKGFEAKSYRYTIDPDTGYLKLNLIDAIGSWGYGFEFFFLGFPIHLEFVQRLEIPDISNPFKIEKYGKFQTNFWIGFDF